MTSPTDLLQPDAPLTSLGADPAQSSAPLAVLDPAAQVAAVPQVTPEAEPPFGSVGDWARWGTLGAVTVGTVYAGNKITSPEVSPQLRDAIQNRLANQEAVKGYPKTVSAMNAARRAQGAANNSMATTVRNATAGARSVIAKTGSTVANAAAARVPGGRTVQNLARGVGHGVSRGASAAATRIGPRAAGLAARVGLRLALFAIPGAGWVLGAALLTAGWLFDSDARRFVNNLISGIFGTNNSPALDAPPEPPRTYFLPLTGDGDRDSVIEGKDGEMVVLNDTAFGFDPDKVWHPTTPVIETTPTFEATVRAFEELTTAAFAEREALSSILRKYRGEQVVDKAAEYLAPTVASLDAFGTTVLPAVVELVSAHAVQTNNLYLKLRDANNAARQEISNSGDGLLPWTSDVDADRMGQLTDAYSTYATEQDQRNTVVANLFADWTPPTGPGSTLQPAPYVDPVSPVLPQAPGPQAPYTPPGWGGIPPETPQEDNPDRGNDRLSKEEILAALQGLGTDTAPAPETGLTDPFGSGGIQSPFGSGMQDPFGSATQDPFGLSGMQDPFGLGAQNPLGTTATPGVTAGAQPAAAGKVDQARLESKLREMLKEQGVLSDQGAKDTTADKRAKDDNAKDDKKNETTPAAEEELPADQTGTTGTVDAAPEEPPKSPTEMVAEAVGVTPAEDTPPDPAMSKTAEVAGKIIEFDDPKSARMAEVMQAKDGTSPPTVQDAAAEAGFTVPPAGEPIGASVPPSDLRPGDLIMGDNNRNGLYLGDGQVLTGGEVRPIADVANFTGEGHGVFRLEDTPEPAPAGDPAAPTDGATPAQEAEGTATSESTGPADAATPTGENPAPTGEDPAPVDPGPTDPQPAMPTMPLPHASTPTSEPTDGAPSAPTVPVGD